MERFEVFSLGKHYLHVHTEKGFTLYANAKLVNGQLTSYTDKMVRRGGSWVIDVWKFLNKKNFPVNPIYTAVFGFDSEDTAVSVNSTDIDVDSISGVNGQMVDIGSISLAEGETLPISEVIPVNESSNVEVYKEGNNIFMTLPEWLDGYTEFSLIGGKGRNNMVLADKLEIFAGLGTGWKPMSRFSNGGGDRIIVEYENTNTSILASDIFNYEYQWKGIKFYLSNGTVNKELGFKVLH